MKDFIFFGLATAFNRGGMFLILPFLAYFLSVSDYGNFTLYLILIQLLIPFISVNYSTIIAREYFEKKVIVNSILVFYNIVFIVIFILLCCLFLIFNKTFFLFFLLLISETIFLINSTFLRFSKGSFPFFIACLLKISILSLCILLIYFFDRVILSDINVIFYIFIISNFPILFFLNGFYSSLRDFRIKSIFKQLRVNFGLFLFAIALLPHTISQWISSSSDRFFLKILTDDISLGYYSFAYSLAAIYMIVNSALALGTPQLAVQNFTFFSSKRFSKLYFLSVTILWFLFSLIFGFIVYFFNWKYPKELIFTVGYIVLVGLYFLSFYYYYSSFLFYYRKVKNLSLLTFSIAILNIVLVLLFTPLLGINGTALATFFSYLVYSYITYRQVNYIQNVRSLRMPFLFVIFVTIILFIVKFKLVSLYV